MNKTINVRANLGSYDLFDRNRKSVSVNVTVPALSEKTIWFNVDPDRDGREINEGECWSDYVVEMCDVFIASTWVSTAMADVKRLKEWLGDERNSAEMDAAWAEREVAACDRQQAALDKRRARAASVVAACAEVLSSATSTVEG